mgnify:CR=1 FL=1
MKRDELIKILSELTWHIRDEEFGGSDVQCIDAPALTTVADFILADRKRVLDEVEKPLREYKSKFVIEDWAELVNSNQEIKSIDEALSKIAELRGDKCSNH